MKLGKTGWNLLAVKSLPVIISMWCEQMKISETTVSPKKSFLPPHPCLCRLAFHSVPHFPPSFPIWHWKHTVSRLPRAVMILVFLTIGYSLTQFLDPTVHTYCQVQSCLPKPFFILVHHVKIISVTGQISRQKKIWKSTNLEFCPCWYLKSYSNFLKHILKFEMQQFWRYVFILKDIQTKRFSSK